MIRLFPLAEKFKELSFGQDHPDVLYVGTKVFVRLREEIDNYLKSQYITPVDIQGVLFLGAEVRLVERLPENVVHLVNSHFPHDPRYNAYMMLEEGEVDMENDAKWEPLIREDGTVIGHVASVPKAKLPETQEDLDSDAIFAEILQRRREQDAQWGGPRHDDRHTREEWCGYLQKFLDRAEIRSDRADAASYEDKLLDIAALAVAAIQSSRRKRREG